MGLWSAAQTTCGRLAHSVLYLCQLISNNPTTVYLSGAFALSLFRVLLRRVEIGGSSPMNDMGLFVR